MTTTDQAAKVDPYVIVATTCRRCGVELADVLGAARYHRAMVARAIAAHLMQTHLRMTSRQISAVLKRTNNSSVRTSLQWLGKLMAATGDTVNVGYGGRAVAMEHPAISIRAINHELGLGADAVK